MYDFARRAGLRPQFEPRSLFDERAEAQDEHWPADVMVIPHLALAYFHPDGSRVCFDFAVTNALGPAHWADTALTAGLPSETYDPDKRQRNNSEQRCRDAGLSFWLVALEQ